jgi:acetylornithine deacetylase/succinyl-diaminopimelate desuccinylase-like protein
VVWNAGNPKSDDIQRPPVYHVRRAASSFWRNAMVMTPEQLIRLREIARARTEAVADLIGRICAVPSPTGAEGERARFVAEQFRQRGYEPEIDDVNNVYTRRGNRGGPVLMILAHIDTVFPAGTPIEIRREGDFLYGPGIGDNSSKVGGMIHAFDVLDELAIETPVDIVAVGNVGEEGLGNLRGARQAVERFRDQLGAVIVLDARHGTIINTAVGSNRWKVTVTGPGGHSFGAFGLPSAIHGLGRIIAQLAAISVPAEPKTTYNVGIIEGGTSVNTIAPQASALVDMRSVSVEELDKLSQRVREIIETAPGDGLESQIEVVGERPAGSRPTDDPLVMKAAEVIRWMGLEPTYEAASTDANIPISLGIPTVCVGLTRGERGHTVYEYIEVPPIGEGLAGIVRLCVEACDMIANGELR